MSNAESPPGAPRHGGAAAADASIELAAEAYLYYAPLVENLDQVRRFAQHGLGQNPAAPYNVFSHARRLATDKDTVAAIDADTLTSVAQLDLSTGPIVLSVPATGERYVVLQFVDAWTDTFAYVGTRATGPAGGEFLIVPTGYEGEVPAGMTAITAPTDILSIIGRFACDGGHDLRAVHAVQDALALATLWEAVAPATGVVAPADVDPELAFWEKARAWSLAYPPSEADQRGQRSFEALGAVAETSPYLDPPAELRDALVAGAASGAEKIEQLSSRDGAAEPGGWRIDTHAVDYNVSYFELGTVHSPEWTTTAPAQRFVARAVAARSGRPGIHGYEAVSAHAFTDAGGRPLHGTASYTITLPQDPPVDASWSITACTVPDGLLVANPIDRFSIGDRTPGTIRAADGSLTITVAHDAPPDATARANWLPVPVSGFRLVFRLYLPRDEVLGGRYRFPPVERSSSPD